MVSTAPAVDALAELEADWKLWLGHLFPEYVTAAFAAHHEQFWQWAWQLRPGVAPRPPAFVGIWPRGGAKSTSAELAVVALSARKVRQYALYVCDTQDRANQHVETIGEMYGAAAFRRIYPWAGRPRIGNTGRVRAWRQNRLQLPGFTIDAVGLDRAVRGAKDEEVRPDLIVFDDIDSENDSAVVTGAKRRKLTRAILPTQGPGCAFIGIQNLILPSGIFAQFARGVADLLYDRVVSGPIPALRQFDPTQDVERVDGRYRILRGSPTWKGQDLARCEEMLNSYGLEAFAVECQHDLAAQDDRVFPTFDPNIHRYLRAELPKFSAYYGGLDFGGEGFSAHWSTGCLIGRTVGGRALLLHTWKQRGPNVAEGQMRWMLEMEQRYPGVQWAADRTQPLGIQLLRSSGFNIRPSRAGGADDASRERRITTLAASLRVEGGNPGFWYMPTLADFEDEMLSYRREPPPAPDMPGKRLPIRVHDDVIDAVLYAEELRDRARTEQDGLPRPIAIGIG